MTTPSPSPSPSPSLSQLQAWFLTTITTPGGVQAGLARARAAHGYEAQEVLRPGRADGMRLPIYANGYVQRLLECLREEFPLLRQHLGAELFDFFAQGYIARHPSTSTTLYDLGRSFPDFLARSRPAGVSAEDAALLAFPLDLARLERALSEAALAEGLEKQPATFDVLDLMWAPDATVCLAPCTRLLALSFPMEAFWALRAVDNADQANQANHALPAVPPHAPSFAAIGRRHYRVDMHVLQPWQYYFLLAASSETSLHHCATQAAKATGVPTGRVLADALLWLPQASAAALLS